MTTLTTAGIIVSQGTTAILNAWRHGTTIAMGSLVISSDVMACTGDETTMTSIVYTVPSAAVSWNLSGTSLTATLSLGTAIGTFVIGTVGILLSDGSLFALAQFSGAGTKIASSPPSVLGNSRTLNIVMVYDNLPIDLSSIIGESLITGSNVLASIESILNTLPTAPPSGPNKLWLSSTTGGHILCITPP